MGNVFGVGFYVFGIGFYYCYEELMF